MTLTKLENTLIELGLNETLAANLEMAHNRFIRSTVENTPNLKRIAEFMEDFRDEVGNEKADIAIAHGAIMHFTRANPKVAGKVKERIANNMFVKEIVTEYQALEVRPEYDILAVEDEMMDF